MNYSKFSKVILPNVKQAANDLKQSHELTDYEALDIATKIVMGYCNIPLKYRDYFSKLLFLTKTQTQLCLPIRMRTIY